MVFLDRVVDYTGAGILGSILGARGIPEYVTRCVLWGGSSLSVWWD